MEQDKNDATTYLISCPTGTETSSCEFEQPFTLIEGPKTLHFAFVAPTAASTQTFIFDCALQGTTSMGCTATGVSDDASPSAPITTTQALTYTGDVAKGFFRSVTLVTDSRELMTHTPGVLKGHGVSTTVGDVTSEKTVKTGSVIRTASATSAATSISASATKIESIVSCSVSTYSAESTASTTPFAGSSAFVSASGTSATVGAITTSGARTESASWGLMAITILAAAVAVGDINS